MTKRMSAILLAAPVMLILSALVLSTGIVIAESESSVVARELLKEMQAQSQGLVNVTMAVHDETEKIADDESLDGVLRSQAESIHVASHDLWHLAEDVSQHIEELEGLCDYPEANKGKINESLNEIAENLGEYATIQVGQEDSVHSILSAVPESHKEYADKTHNSFHEAEDIINDLLEGISELRLAIGVEVKATD